MTDMISSAHQAESEALISSFSSSQKLGYISEESEKPTPATPTKPNMSFKLMVAHIIHGSLLVLHVVALVASIKGWNIPVDFLEVSTFQSGITAALQVAFVLINGILISIVRDIAIDADIRHPPTLGILHLRLKAWSSLWSSLTANWAYFRSHTSLQGSQRLKRIVFYLGACAILQISSSSIFGMYYNENSTSTLFDVWWPYIIQGSRFGEYDQLWSSHINISSADKRLFPPAAMVAAQTMFAGRVNDTRYPGLQGRLIHDTTNLDNAGTLLIPWTQARVNATEFNVHCSQIGSAATINTFVLPSQSSDLSLAKSSPQNGSQKFIFENTTTEDGAWINFTMPAPPYWDPVIPGLNFTAYWGSSDSFDGLPTQVFFQPWVFPASSTNIGHHQVIMVIATQRNQSLLTDVNNSLGNLLNFTTSPDETSCFEDLCHAYIQAIGCTLTSQNLTATIDTQGRLLDPHTDVMQLEGPELPHDDHAWDEFSWEDSTNLAGIDRQFLLAFSPTSFYNNSLTSDESDISIPLPVGNPEQILSKMLDGDLFSPFAGTSNPISNASSLVEFQGSLERLYASYLWNINRLCSPFDSLQPYWEYCGQYWDEPYSSADLVLELPLSTGLTIVFWRAIVSVACSVIMLLLGFAILGTAVDRERNIPPQGQGFLNTARLLEGSTIPELVAGKAQTVKTSRNPEPEILEAVLTHRLSYRHHSKDGSAGGFLDVDD